MGWQDVLEQSRHYSDRAAYNHALDIIRHEIPKLSRTDQLRAWVEIGSVLDAQGQTHHALDHLYSCIGRLPEDQTPVETLLGIHMKMRTCLLRSLVTLCFKASVEEAKLLRHQMPSSSAIDDLDFNRV